MAHSWTDGLLLKIINLICYLLFLASNIYTLTFPTGSYYNPKLTYITPAPWAFLIWIVIHILLLGTVIYQFFPAGKHIIVDGISWRFPFLSILNAIYIHVWAEHDYIVAFVFALFFFSTVTQIYYIVRKHHGPHQTADELFIHIPFSLYHGWTTVLVVLNAFEAFGINAVDHPPGVWTKHLVFLGLFFLEGTAATYTFSTPDGDLPGSFAIAWSLWAIFVQQRNLDPLIYWSALAFAILALAWVIMGVFRLSRRYKGATALHDEERASLLGGA
ncbi:hypothetical protein L218DRAFT_878992 [Marasmius fiardii PR-910]|nr:hypothetical protein L218DRAFT_878992 [Marasmius fiardii PR-910]